MNVFILIFFLLNHINLSYSETNKLQFYLNNKQYKKAAIYMYKTTPKKHRNGVFYFNTGQLFYEYNDFKKAIYSYKKVIALNSGLKDAAKVYLFKTYIKSKKLKSAFSFYKKNKIDPQNKSIQLIWQNTREDLFDALITRAIVAQKRGQQKAALKYFKLAYDVKKNSKVAEFIELIVKQDNNPKETLYLLRKSFNRSKNRQEKKLYKRLYYKTLSNLRNQFRAKYGVNTGYTSKTYSKKPAQPVTETRGPYVQLFFDKLVSKKKAYSLTADASLDYTQNQVDKNSNSYINVGFENTFDFKTNQFVIDTGYESYLFDNREYSKEYSLSLMYSQMFAKEYYVGAITTIDDLKTASDLLSANNYTLTNAEFFLIQGLGKSQLRYSFLLTNNNAPPVSYNGDDLAQSYKGIGGGFSFYHSMTEKLNYSIRLSLKRNEFSHVETLSRNENIVSITNDFYYHFRKHSHTYLTIGYHDISSNLTEADSYNTNYRLFSAVIGVSISNINW